MTQSLLLVYFLEQVWGISAKVLLKRFGPSVEQPLRNLIELGMVYEYSRSGEGQHFGVCRRWR